MAAYQMLVQGDTVQSSLWSVHPSVRELTALWLQALSMAANKTFYLHSVLLRHLAML